MNKLRDYPGANGTLFIPSYDDASKMDVFRAYRMPYEARIKGELVKTFLYMHWADDDPGGSTLLEEHPGSRFEPDARQVVEAKEANDSPLSSDEIIQLRVLLKNMCWFPRFKK